MTDSALVTRKPFRIIEVKPTSADGDKFVDGDLFLEVEGSRFGAMAGDFFLKRRMTGEQLRSYNGKDASGNFDFSVIPTRVIEASKEPKGRAGVTASPPEASLVRLRGRIVRLQPWTVSRPGETEGTYLLVTIDAGFLLPFVYHGPVTITVGDWVEAEAYAFVGAVDVVDDPFPSHR